MEALRAGLRELGHVEGKSLAYEYRAADGKYERLPALAAELIGLKVDVLVTAGTPGALALNSRFTFNFPPTRLIQIDIDPSEIGRNYPVEIGAVADLKQALARLKRVAVLMNPDNAAMAPVQREMAQAGAKLGVEIVRFDVRGPDEFEGAFAGIAAKRADAVVIVEDGMLNVNASRLGALATAKRLPSIGVDEVADGGGLLAYGVNQREMFRRAAAYVDKILKGAKPADLPIERSSTFSLVLNLKTARQLALAVPPEIRLRADRVIE